MSTTKVEEPMAPLPATSADELFCYVSVSKLYATENGWVVPKLSRLIRASELSNDVLVSLAAKLDKEVKISAENPLFKGLRAMTEDEANEWRQDASGDEE